MVHPNTRRSTALLVLVALAHVVHHSFVVAPLPALPVHCSVRPSGITKTLVLRQVGANQHWPYGLVGDEKSYARQVDGNFFADVKNSSFFLKALKEDARDKQVDADAHLKTVRLNAKKFMQGNTIVDRKAFIQSLTDAIFEDGKRQVKTGQSCWSTRRQMPAKDFYEATLSVASKQTNVLDILTQLPLVGKRFRAGPQSRVWRFIQQLPFMAPALGALRAGVATAAAPLAMAVQNFVKSLDDDHKAQALSELVKSIVEKGNDTTIIIDEANLALPNDGNDAKAETVKRALAQITGSTKEAFQASVVLISSEHGYPFKLAKAGLNLVDIKNIIIAPEVPPVDMFKMLTGHWGMGPRLDSSWPPTAALLMNKRDQFYPLRTTSVPGIGNCLGQDDAREHLINIALDGFSPVSVYETDEGAIRASAKNVAGIIPGEAQAPGLWPEVFHETDEKYVLVASTHHVRLLICEALLNKGYIQNNGGNLARVSPSWFQSLLQIFR
ncbi:unnamed protein product [Symbiodinium sp. CCMP2592]|nr:unnamed protein product [Symbiodinium sp. CCMP2592]